MSTSLVPDDLAAAPIWPTARGEQRPQHPRRARLRGPARQPKARRMDIDILIEAPDWEALDMPALTRAACAATLAELGLAPDDFALSVLLCDDERIAGLNAQFRAKPTPTNVLSWPAESRAPSRPGAMPDLPQPGPSEIGDLALAYGICAAEARAAGKPLAQHLAHLIVHGVLHCLGFDHETEADAQLMEGLETRILARQGLPDPY